MRFVNPLARFAFKRIFGSKDGKEVLISFLNAVLMRDAADAIVEATLLDPDETPNGNGLRDSDLDVICRDVHGVTFIVEMQVAHDTGIKKRAVYNASRAYTDQGFRGEAHHPQVMSVSILDFNLFGGFEHYHSCHEMREQATGNNYFNGIRYYLIELPKFKKTKAELDTYIEKWTYFIKHAADLEAIPEKLDEPVFHKAFDLASRAKMTPEELEAYDASVAVMLDERGRRKEKAGI